STVEPASPAAERGTRPAAPLRSPLQSPAIANLHRYAAARPERPDSHHQPEGPGYPGTVQLSMDQRIQLRVVLRRRYGGNPRYGSGEDHDFVGLDHEHRKWRRTDFEHRRHRP